MIWKVTDVLADRYAKLVQFANSSECIYGQDIVDHWRDSHFNPVYPSPSSVVAFRDLKGPGDDQTNPTLNFTLVIREVSSFPIETEEDEEKPGRSCGYWPSPVPRRIINRILDIIGRFPDQELGTI